MKCPKCGAIIEEGKSICFMCGTNINEYTNNQQEFSNYNPSLNEEYYQKKEQYNNRFTNYRDINYDSIAKNDKDIFDFFSENKKKIKLIFLLLLVVLICFGAYKFYKYKTTEKPEEPLINNLYYQVDDTFKNVNNSQNEMVYAKSGEKGNDCSISITYGTSTSADHVNDLYKSIKENDEESYLDNDNNVINENLVPMYQENEKDINGTKWNFLNVFYKDEETLDYTVLKYRYFTAMYKGYFYDITLINNSNDNTCNLLLDNFVKSLKFVDS